MKLKKIYSALVVLFSGLGICLGQTSVTGFSPIAGTNGQQQIVITGAGFSNTGLIVRFNGVLDTTATATTTSQIRATVPLTATTGPISVKVGSNPLATSADDFQVISQAPYILSFPPSAAEGVSIRIDGLNFSGVTSVKFNGQAAFFSMTSVDRIDATVPANVTTGPISITSPKGTGTSTNNFFAAPGITSFSPVSGRAGTNVIITGKNFLGAVSVKLNNVAIPSFVVNSNTQISVVIPQDAVTGKLSVTAGGNAGQFITTSNIVVLPAIYSFSPFFGKPGTNVTIVGAHFLGNPSVTFNGANAVLVGTPTANQIIATVPAAATSGPIVVTTTNGSVASSTNFFLPPTISGFSPSTGAAGSMVAVTGANFTNATDVSFNGTPAIFTVVNNGLINATVPAAATSGPISVTTPGGSVTNTQNFFAQPSLISFSPTSGVASTIVTINGTSFTNVTAVRFNGVNANFTQVNNTQLTATVPTNATTGPISVVAPGGTAVSASNFVVDVLALSIKLLSNNVVSISWPSSATGFNLQSSTNLSTTNWVLVTNAPSVLNGRNTVTNAATNSALFYRLKK